MDFRVRWLGDAHPHDLSFFFFPENTPHNLNNDKLLFPWAVLILSRNQFPDNPLNAQVNYNYFQKISMNPFIKIHKTQQITQQVFPIEIV